MVLDHPRVEHLVIGLHRGMLPHLAHPRATGTSGQLKNESSCAIEIRLREAEAALSLTCIFTEYENENEENHRRRHSLHSRGCL